MQTIKTKMFQSFIVTLAGLIAVSVLLLSVHAKDLVQHNDITGPARGGYHDINDKVASELHDHVDKKILKAPVKTAGEGMIFSRGRDDDFTPEHEQDPGILGRLEETLLVWRALASLPFRI